MKKVLIIILSMEGGGAEKVLLDFLSNYDTSKFKIDLLVLAKNGDFLNDIPSHIHTIFLSSNLTLIKLLSILKLSFIERYLLNRLKISKYDTIISFYEGIAVKYHSYLLSLNCRNISWIHMDLCNNHYTKKYFWKNEEKTIYCQMDQILFVSKDALDQFNKLYPSIDVQKDVVYNPININLIQKLGQNSTIIKRKFTICAIGRLHSQKDYPTMLKVAKNMKDRGIDFDLWILGAGKQYADLSNTITKYGLSDNVFLLGFNKNPYQYLAKSDIFLSTSIFEGFSLVVAESLCLGIPVISTKNTGPKELLDNGKYGILTDHNVVSITDAITSLMFDNSKLELYRRLSKERSTIFNLENTINTISKYI